MLLNGIALTIGTMLWKKNKLKTQKLVKKY